jgi:hypothetical protein
MSTVLQFRQSPQRPRGPRAIIGPPKPCEVVIFPGVRIERHDVDLAHRLFDSAGSGTFDDLGGKPRPRKTS